MLKKGVFEQPNPTFSPTDGQSDTELAARWQEKKYTQKTQGL